VAEAVLVAGSWEGKIGNSGLANRVVTRENRERRGKRGVKRRRRRGLPRGLVVALNPRELAAGVQHHLLGLRRCPDGEPNDQSHRIRERRFVVVQWGPEPWVSPGLRNEGRVESCGGVWTERN
jgi:hypothetical protein